MGRVVGGRAAAHQRPGVSRARARATPLRALGGRGEGDEAVSTPPPMSGFFVGWGCGRCGWAEVARGCGGGRGRGWDGGVWGWLRVGAVYQGETPSQPQGGRHRLMRSVPGIGETGRSNRAAS